MHFLVCFYDFKLERELEGPRMACPKVRLCYLLMWQCALV